MAGSVGHLGPVSLVFQLLSSTAEPTADIDAEENFGQLSKYRKPTPHDAIETLWVIASGNNVGRQPTLS